MERPRYFLIDTLRGLAMVNVIVYHFIYDLINFYGFVFPWFASTPVYLVQQGTVCLFVFISGMMSHCANKLIRNGLLLLGCGLLNFLVTYLFFPEFLILFGILSLLGWAALITYFLRPLLERVPAFTGAAMSILLFFITHDVADGNISIFGNKLLEIPKAFYSSTFLFPLGFPASDFFSADYFPLLPWIFPYWLGYFCWQMADEELRKKYFFRHLPALTFMGKHSLLLYLIHQPIILAVTGLFF
ncbi:MAG: heparan-alpha-glucosaminide N-acetyltransferase domain-containing protein [Acidaminococcaceae bacterium]